MWGEIEKLCPLGNCRETATDEQMLFCPVSEQDFDMQQQLSQQHQDLLIKDEQFHLEIQTPLISTKLLLKELGKI
jgi:hypothetical protein